MKLRSANVRVYWLLCKNAPSVFRLLTELLARQSSYARGDVSAIGQSEHLFLCRGRRVRQPRKTGRDAVLSGSPASPLLWFFWTPWSFSRPKINPLSRYRACKCIYCQNVSIYHTSELIIWLQQKRDGNGLASKLAKRLSQRLCCWWAFSCCSRSWCNQTNSPSVMQYIMPPKHVSSFFVGWVKHL